MVLKTVKDNIKAATESIHQNSDINQWVKMQQNDETKESRERAFIRGNKSSENPGTT